MVDTSDGMVPEEAMECLNRNLKHRGYCTGMSLCVSIDAMEIRNVSIKPHHHHGHHPMRRGPLRP